jgi:hypothetical protein
MIEVRVLLESNCGAVLHLYVPTEIMMATEFNQALDVSEQCLLCTA